MVRLVISIGAAATLSATSVATLARQPRASGAVVTAAVATAVAGVADSVTDERAYAAAVGTIACLIAALSFVMQMPSSDDAENRV